MVFTIPPNTNYQSLDTTEDDFVEANNHGREPTSGNESSSEEEASTLWELLPSRLNLKSAERFTFDLSFQLTNWCAKMEDCMDAQVIKLLGGMYCFIFEL